MTQNYSVSLEKIIAAHNLEIIYLPKPADEILITTNEVNRPGIVMTGYTDYFDAERIRGLDIPDYFVEECKAHQVPLLRTQEETSPFLATLIAYLNAELAPRITRHGVLVEVYGEGVLITGESGAEIRKVSDKTLIGASPSNIRHFVELRGIGIINARRIFGMGAVKNTEKIDMVIQLEAWDSTKAYDRLGLDNEYTRILDIQVPVITVPITPGRNLAVIVETAAMNNRQRADGRSWDGRDRAGG